MLRRLLATVAVCTVTGCGASTTRSSAPQQAVSSTASAKPSSASAAAPTAASPSTPARPAVPATGGAGYDAALSARLLSADSVPSGFTVKIATTMAPDAGDQRPAADAPCSESLIPFLSGTRLTGTPSAMAAATVSGEAGPGQFWVGGEVLRTYSGDGARQALADLRAFVGRCPVVTTSSGQDVLTFRFAVAPGPRLGDESVRLSCSMASGSDPLLCDSVFIRTGTTLVVVQDQGDQSEDDPYLAQLAEAGVRRYQSAGS